MMSGIFLKMLNEDTFLTECERKGNIIFLPSDAILTDCVLMMNVENA